MKLLLTILFIFSITLITVAQQTITLNINGKKSGFIITKEDGASAVLKLKKQKVSLIKNMGVTITGVYMDNTSLKKDLEVKLGDSIIATISEDKIKKNTFIFTKAIAKMIASGKKTALTLYLNPSNPQSMMPSRMIPLCYILMK